MDNQPRTEQDFDEKFGKTHLKKKFSFNEQELKEFNQYSTAYLIAKMLEQSANNLSGKLISMVAERVALKNSPAVQILPTETGLITWEPKVWCNVCDNQQATYKYNEKPVCEMCLAKLQAEDKKASEIKVEEKAKEEKPVEEKKK